MKVCSFCQRCYDDQIVVCDSEGHGSLSRARHGNCTIVTGYRIDSRLESGSPVELYRATHLASEKSVLIRFIEPGGSVSCVEKELSTVSRLNHPNLGRVFEFGNTSDEEMFVVLEDYSGLSLSDYLKSSPSIKERRAIEIVRQISEGLEALHAAGVVHKAVNPSSIYFTIPAYENCPVKLSHYDFGGLVQKDVAETANFIEPDAESMFYFSPEQFTDSEIGFKSDLYSLGAVFYELLVGHPPVEVADPLAIISYAFNESDLRDLPIDLRGLISHSLREAFQKRLEMRPQTTGNYVRQLRHIEQIASRSSSEAVEKALAMAANRSEEQSVSTSIPKPTEIELFRKEVIEEVEVEAVEIYLNDEAETERNSLEESEQDAEIVNTFSGDGSKYDKPKADKHVGYATEDFVILSADYDENSDPDEYIHEYTDWEGSEFVIDPVESAVQALVRVDPAAIPARKDGSLAVVYLAGVLIMAVFGGIFTAGFIEWQGAYLTSNTNKSADGNLEKAADTPLETPKTAKAVQPDTENPVDQELLVEEAEEPEYPGEPDDEASIADKVVSIRTISSKAPKVQERKRTKAKPRQRRKQKSSKRKNNVPADNLTAKSRPRWVQNVVIYY